jgi:hypothetical protein
VAERQILRTGRRSNRVRLHEAEGFEGLRQGRRWKEATRDRVAAQFVDCQSTSIIANVSNDPNDLERFERFS